MDTIGWVAGVDTGQASSLPQDLLDGRYTVQRLVGADDCGDVMLALEAQSQQQVAIHHLTAGHPAYDRCLARFQRAAQVSALVHHPNLVAVHSCTIAPDRDAYLVMEFVDGPTLRAAPAVAGGIAVDRALAIARDSARALQALHEHDIVHRDLSPAHLLLARDGTTKVTGLGEAQIGRDSPILQLGAPRPGAPGYRSPELDSGFGSLDGRSDLYSLGAILYEMLTGTPYEPMLRPVNIARPDLPRPLVALVTKLLERQPAFRFARAADVLREIDTLLEPPPAPAVDAAAVGASAAPAPPAPLPAADASPPPPAPARPVPPTPVLAPARPSQPVARPTAPPAGDLSKPIFHPLPEYDNAPRDPRAEARETARRNRRQGRRGWGWIIGTLFAVLLIVRGCSSAHVTRGPTSTPRPPPTATPLAATRTAIASQPALWQDPKGRLNLTLPPGWRVVGTGSKPEDVATLLGPDGVFMLIRTYKPTRTIDADFQATRTNQSLATNRTFTQSPVTEVAIGGETGRYMEFRAVYTTPATGSSSVNAPYGGVEWLADHGGVRYDFLVADIKSRRADCDAIVGSVVFTK